MRSDFGLKSLYDEESAPRRHGPEEADPMPPDSEIEGFTEGLGRPVDLEYFSPQDEVKGGTDDEESELDSPFNGAK